MQVLEEEILEITESTWNSLLGLDITPSPLTTQPTEWKSLFVEHVEISGAWNGEVISHSSGALAQVSAATTFAIAPQDVQDQDQIEAIYELSNIIAGNIKSFLPEPSLLSLTTVQKSTTALMKRAGCERVRELGFECGGKPLAVTLWKQNENN